MDSIQRVFKHVVYVDSGSTDESITFVSSKNIDFIELDMSVPFCAARARNEGFRRLVKMHPEIRYVQFIDGDCEIIGDWLQIATSTLQHNQELAIVAGWLRERFPENSIYNRLGDLEWNFSGIGYLDSVGGIFMIRREAFEAVGGFDPTVAAGEEPVLCKKLRGKGWKIFKLDQDMAHHDLAMTRFGQWWKRMVRSGYGSMDVAKRFNVENFVRNNLRVRMWSIWLFFLISAFFASIFFKAGSGVFLITTIAIFLIFPAQFLRISIKTWRKGHSLSVAIAYAYFICIAFLPQMIGQIMYFTDLLRNRSFRLVEYKGPNS